MPFIGNQPALSYTSFAKQDFTTSATTSYTLDNPVANENEIALFINFVRQEPTTAYTASGTSLTLTSATSASDDMYCVFLGKAVQTVNPPSGSVGTAQLADSSVSLAKLSATGTKDSTTFLRGDNTFASAGGDLTPAFQATKSTAQTVSHATTTKVTWDIETYDTDSAFASNKFTVPTGEDGKYLFYWHLQVGRGVDSDMYRVNSSIYKNGSQVNLISLNLAGTDGRILNAGTTQVLDLSANDYIEIYVNTASSSTNNIFVYGGATETSIFGGYKILGA